MRLTTESGATLVDSWKTQTDLSKTNGFPIPTTLLAPTNSGNVDWYNLAKQYNFKVYRKSPSYFINYFDKDSFETGCIGINNSNIATIKADIDSCVALGNSISIITHSLTATDDTATNGTLNTSIANYTILLEYIKSYVNQGLLEAVTYKDFYNICVDSSRDYREVDINFLLETIKSMSNKIYALENPT